MRNKSLFLLLACVCGTVAAIGVSQWMQANKGSATLETVEIFVTAQAIGEQEEITADKIRLEQWPADKVPQGATADLAALEGRFAKQAFYSGEIVLEAKLMNDKNDVIVPKGYIVVSMPTNRNNGVANLVKQGDRVNIDAYFTKSELFPETKNVTILSGVKVFAIDGKTKADPDEKKAKTARDISLLIREADRDAWILAERNADLSLSLGSTGNYDQGAAEGEPSETGVAFLKWMEDHRAEQRRLKKEAAERERRAAEAAMADDGSESPDVVPRKKKNTFTTTKIVDGRMIVYEWTPGSPVPKIIADTGGVNEQETELDEDGLDDEPMLDEESDDYSGLNGEESPFYQPRER